MVHAPGLNKLHARRIAGGFLLAVWLLLATACDAAGTDWLVPVSYRTRQVVILVIDGARRSETWDDPSRANIPGLAALAGKGVLMAGFRNNGYTYTSSGHAAITTGAYEPIDNNGLQLPGQPSIFQHFLRAAALPATGAWVITSKDKLAVLGNTAQSAWKGVNQPALYCGKGGGGLMSGYGEDADTMAKTKEVLAKWHPRLLLVSLKQPDPAGHSGDWQQYLAALRESDRLAAGLWDWLQADSFYAGTTTLLITHDHGRHLDGVWDGFAGHGDGCEGCRNIALLALGPDCPSGKTIASGGELIDIPVTVAALLGFKLPDRTGRVLGELFN